MPRLTKQEVMERLCDLQAKVVDEVYHFQHAGDCFCGVNSGQTDLSYCNDGFAVRWIVEAVEEKIARLSTWDSSEKSVPKRSDLAERIDGLNSRLNNMSLILAWQQKSWWSRIGRKSPPLW